MAERSYYEILEVSQEIDEGGLKKAFRRLAMEYHPDRNPEPEAADRFREIQEAYSVLSDPEKRSIYDRFGKDGLRGGGFSSRSMDDMFGGFQSIFEDFFGGAAARGPAKGRDLLYRLEIEFREAAFGGERKIKIPRREVCGTCEGTRSQKGKTPEVCTQCQGSGKIRQSRGFFVIAQDCPRCAGEGQWIRHPCSDCRGLGLQEKEVELDLKIPAGVDTGMRLRMESEGEAGDSGARRGDLYVEIQVAEDPVFERDGADLFTRVYVPYPDLLLNREIEVEMLSGEKKKVKLPSEIQFPYVHRVRNEGIVELRSHRRGDLHIELQLELPKKISKKAKELLRELQEELK